MDNANSHSSIPFVTTEQMREVDRLMVEEYGILLVQMMESAGRSLAHLVRSRFFTGDPRGRRVLVLAGAGGNGGGGMVYARWLHSLGAEVRVHVAAAPSRMASATRHQINILERMGIEVEMASNRMNFPPSDLIVDALIGYSLRGAPTGVVATLIGEANNHGTPIVSLDVPSGVDAATGMVYDPSVCAAATLTLALPKEGLRGQEARKCVGELYLADIGVPPGLYALPSLNLTVGPIFATEDIVRLW